MATFRKALFIFLFAMKLTTVAYIARLDRSYFSERSDKYAEDLKISDSCKCEKSRPNNLTEHLKVVSYSLYGDTENENIQKRYFRQVKLRVLEVEKLYKGWQIRVYHNLTSQYASFEKLCELQCQFPMMIDLIDMDKPSNKKKSHINPRLWRFLPLLDEDVKVLITRDLDSKITTRETSAVDQWLNSSLSFHVMRDHPLHGASILAGTWGIKISQHPSLAKNIGNLMLYLGTAQDKAADQRFLGLYVWPLTQHDTMAHDSYHCKRWDFTFFGWLKSHPFPTRRDGFDFVGNIDIRHEQQTNSTNGLTTCPISCRPTYGKSWRYC